MHKDAKGLARERIVKQVTEGDTSIYDYSLYIPVGNAVRKLQEWKAQGARICYLSSHRNARDVEQDKIPVRRILKPSKMGQFMILGGGDLVLPLLLIASVVNQNIWQGIIVLIFAM